MSDQVLVIDHDRIVERGGLVHLGDELGHVEWLSLSETEQAVSASWGCTS